MTEHQDDIPGTEDTTEEAISPAPSPRSSADPLIGTKIGSCTLKRIIGSGGMGTVYEAVQENPRRRVALKMMKRGITSRSATRRFEFESQTLARLKHQGVAQIYEAGTHDDGSGGVPYFIMEYIANAKTITNYADEEKLDMKDRLSLFTKVCDAVQHGHLKGIVHRDLKPGNILVDSSSQPKIIDFGVARSTDSDLAVTTLQTDVGQLIGTLQYMSPEQCEADPSDIDVRSDVYALGVILYELLTGKPPYDLQQKVIHEAVRIVREEEPKKLSTFNRRLRGDIEIISIKALEKNRDRRYQSATSLEDDINRYLNGESIIARKPSIVDFISKWVKHHRIAAVALTIACVLVPPGAALGWAWQNSRELNNALTSTLHALEISQQESQIREFKAIAAQHRLEDLVRFDFNLPGLPFFRDNGLTPLPPVISDENAAVVIPLEGMVSDGTLGTPASFIKENIRSSLEDLDKNYPSVTTVIFDIDSGGGLVIGSHAIAELIQKYQDNSRFHFVAFVRYAAASAALIALSCDQLVPTTNSQIGATTMYSGSIENVVPTELLLEHADFWAKETGRPIELFHAMTSHKHGLWLNIITKELSNHPPKSDDFEGNNFSASEDWVQININLMLNAEEMVAMDLAKGIAEDLVSVGNFVEPSVEIVYDYGPAFNAMEMSHLWTAEGRLDGLLHRFISFIYVAEKDSSDIKGEEQSNKYFTLLTELQRLSTVINSGYVRGTNPIPNEIKCLIKAVETFTSHFKNSSDVIANKGILPELALQLRLSINTCLDNIVAPTSPPVPPYLSK